MNSKVYPLFSCCLCGMLTFAVITSPCRNPKHPNHCFHTIVFKKNKRITADYREGKDFIQMLLQELHKKKGKND